MKSKEKLKKIGFQLAKVSKKLQEAIVLLKTELKKLGFWLLDRIWPTIDTTEVYTPPSRPQWIPQTDTQKDVIEAAYGVLKDALKEQDERLKTVDSKLQGVSFVAPIIITIIFGIITFLTGEKTTSFGSKGLLLIEIGGCYVALQFLRALLAAITGLSVRGFSSIFFNEAPPQKNETKEQYLFRICQEISKAIYENREVINNKVNQLLLAQASVKNAVWGLLIVLFLVLGITIDKTQYYGVGIILGVIILLVLIAILIIKLLEK